MKPVSFSRNLHFPALPFASTLGNPVPENIIRVEQDLMNGATLVPDRGVFDSLAARDDVPGALGVREMKFIITNADQPDARLHFMNTNQHPLHYYFVRNYLGDDITVGVFNRATYFTNDRGYIASSIVACRGGWEPV